MHELTPLHFYKFCPKIEKIHESFYIFTNFVQKLKKNMDKPLSKLRQKIKEHGVTTLYFFQILAKN